VSIGQRSIVVGNAFDVIPDDHVVIDLRAFDRLNEMPALLGPHKNDGDTYVLLFKRSSVNAIPKVLEKNFPEEAKP